MRTDALEILKRAWLYVRKNRFLWLFGFLIALAGGGSQGYSIAFASPIPRGLTSYSPLHRLGERISDLARGNWLLVGVLIAVGIMAGLAALAVGVLAQASAIGGVAELESGRRADFKSAFRWGKDNFPKVFVLVIAYVALLGLMTVPLFLFWWWVGNENSLFPCVTGTVLGLGVMIASAVASVFLEIAIRFLVLEDNGMVQSIYMAAKFVRRFFREIAVCWLYVLVISLAGVLCMAVVIGVLANPLSWIFNAAYRHHSGLMTAAGIMAFIVAWAITAAASGVFAITGSAVWTVTFLELEMEGSP